MTELILSHMGAFGAGFAAGKYLEKSAHERKQLSAQIEKLQGKLTHEIESDPTLAAWMRDNTPQLLRLLRTLERENNNNG